MKKQLAILNAIQLDLDLFYVVSFRKERIQLQGEATPEAIVQSKKFVELNFNNVNNWLSGKNEFIEITLTF
jgi:hypothetical protein